MGTRGEIEFINNSQAPKQQKMTKHKKDTRLDQWHASFKGWYLYITKIDASH